MAKIPVMKIQRFSVSDGAGVRTTIFLKGCPLKCKWCHNPESQTIKPNIYYTLSLCVGCGRCEAVCKANANKIVNGKRVINRELCTACGECVKGCLSNAVEKDSYNLTASEIISIALKDVAFYGKNGGITLSGGEPLMQMDNALSILEEAKRNGINTAIETCGVFNSSKITDLAKVTNTVLFDIKDTNATRLKNNTGADLNVVLNNLYTLDSLGVKTVLRCILINNVNLNEEHLSNIANVYFKLKNCIGVELFSYHSLGESKYTAIGKTYYGEENWALKSKQLTTAKNFLKNKGVKCKLNRL